MTKATFHKIKELASCNTSLPTEEWLDGHAVMESIVSKILALHNLDPAKTQSICMHIACYSLCTSLYSTKLSYKPSNIILLTATQTG